MGLIAVSLLVAALASAVYLAPRLLSGPVQVGIAVPSSAPLTTVAGERITFTFVSANAGWAAAAVTTDRLWIFASVWELDLTSDGGIHWTQETVPVPG